MKSHKPRLGKKKRDRKKKGYENRLSIIIKINKFIFTAAKNLVIKQSIIGRKIANCQKIDILLLFDHHHIQYVLHSEKALWFVHKPKVQWNKVRV